MASGTQQHQYQHQQQQSQQRRPELPVTQQRQQQQQQSDNQMQFVSNQSLDACYDQQTQLHTNDTLSPIASAPMPHITTMSSHQQQPIQIMQPIISSAPMNQEMCNQASQQHNIHTQQPQTSHLLPLLLSPQPTNQKFSDTTEHQKSDHDQIIEQVISLENEYNGPSVTMANVDNASGMVLNNQSQHHLLRDINITSAQCVSESNQLSNSSEDLLNLLLEFDRDSSNLAGNNQQLDQDEKVGIETIRKQLMSCEVQSDQLLQHNADSMSPVLNQLDSSQSLHVRPTQHSHHNMQQQQVTQQLIPQTAPVISPHRQSQHLMTNSSLSHQQPQQQLSQHHRLSVDQTLLHGSYTSAHLNSVTVSSSGQTYTPQQHQTVTRISQSTPMSMDNNSQSPSWQQPQLSPFSPSSTHVEHNRPPSSQCQQHQTMQNHPLQQQHATSATSPQIQQLHHQLQRRSPSQSISPPATTEPSPVVKKNPLLNAQLVNSRSPSMTPSRFMNSQANVLNQNPILNSKLSQNSFVTNSCSTVGSPVDSSLASHPRFIQHQQQQSQQQSNFEYDIAQQQNAHNLAPQSGYISAFEHNEHPSQQHQPTNQIFRTSNVTTTASSYIPPRGVPQMTMGGTSQSGGLSQQVKQEIRKKVQQPKQQHQTTSLLKQLLSDDNK